MSKTQVRLATEADLDFVLNLNQKNVPKVSSVSKTWLGRYLRDSDLFAVAIFNGLPAGYIIGMNPQTDYESENFRWFKDRYEKFLYVDRLAVAEQFQGHGVGKALYNFVAKSVGTRFPAITCEVNVRPANTESYEFHKKLGFKEVGQQETKGGAIRVAMLLKEIS